MFYTNYLNSFSISGIKLLYVILLMLSAGNSYSQYSLDHITSKNGLSQNSVFCITQDADGFMWFGTQEGLDRFDGINFTHYRYEYNNSNSLCAGFVKVLFNDTLGKRLLVGTDQGLCAINLDRNYSVTRLLNNGKGVTHIFTNHGSLFILSGNKLYELQDDNLKEKYTFNIAVREIILLGSGEEALVVANDGTYLYNLKNKICKIRTTGISNNVVISKVLYCNNNIIIGTLNEGIFQGTFIKNSEVITFVPIYREHGKNTIKYPSALLKDKDGNLLIGTDWNGLYFYNENFKKWQHFEREYNDERNLSSSYILSICQSRDGVLWIGTNGGGINKLSKSKPLFERFYTSIKKNRNNRHLKRNNDVWAIAQLDTNHLIVGTDGNGVAVISLDNKEIKHFYNAKSVFDKSNTVRTIEIFDGKIGIGTDSGLFLVSKKNISNYIHSRILLPSNRILCLKVVDSTLWIGTDSGVKAANFRYKAIYLHGLDNVQINGIFPSKSDGRIWIATQIGLYSYEKSTNTFYKVKYFQNKPITTVLDKKNSFWIGTRGSGLFQIIGTDTLSYLATIKDDVIYGIIEDSLRNIWLSTNNGLLCYNKQSNTFNRYTKEYGIQDEEFNTGAFFKNVRFSMNKFFFGGVNGLNSVFSTPVISEKNNTSIEKCLIVHFKTKKIDSTFVYKYINSSMLLNPFEPEISIYVRIFDYNDPQNNYYSYKFGSDSVWHGEIPLGKPIKFYGDKFNSKILWIRIRKSNGDWVTLEPVRFNFSFDANNEIIYFGKKAYIILILFIVLIFLLILYVITILVQNRKIRSKGKELEIKTKELSDKTIILLKSEFALKEQTIALNQLTEDDARRLNLYKSITQISEFNNNTELIKNTIDILINGKIFDFDYAVFNNIDNIKYSINHKIGFAKSKKESTILHVEEWMKNRTISLNDNDIIVYTVLNNVISHVKSNVVNGNEVDLNDSDSILNKEVFHKYNHADLDRAFIPISVKQDESNETPIILGVIELGYSISSEKYRNGSCGFNEPDLQLLFNSVGQQYLSNYINRVEYQLNLLVKRAEKYAKDHFEFIEKILSFSSKALNVLSSEMSFLSLDDRQIWLSQIPPYGKLTQEQLKKVRDDNEKSPNRRKGIFMHVADEGLAYIADDVSKVDFYIPGLENVLSVMSVPFKYHDTILGIFSLHSDKKNFFNKIKQQTVEKVLNSSIEVFLRLKLSRAISELVEPYNTYEKKDIYKFTLENISKYYACHYISIWENKINAPDTFNRAFALQKASNDSLQRIEAREFSIVKGTEPYLIENLNDLKNKRPLNSIETDALENEFQSMIYVSLPENRGVKRYIILFSKRSVLEIFPEDKTFFSHVSNKMALSISFFEVMAFFNKLTAETYNRNPTDILEDFTKSVQEISGANVLLLFLYDSHQNVFTEAIKPKGIVHDNTIVQRLKSGEITKNDFAYSIIKNGSQFIENDTQYKIYRKEQTEWKGWGIFENDFWHREKIKSLAAIRIEFNMEILGVIFFNYRAKQNFGSNLTSTSPILTDIGILVQLLANLMGRIVTVANIFKFRTQYVSQHSIEMSLRAQNEIARQMIHNINNVFTQLSIAFGIVNSKMRKSELNKDEEISNGMVKLGKAIFQFQGDYLLYRNYLKTENFNIKQTNITALLNDSCKISEFLISDDKIKIKKSYGETKEINVWCDKIQINHVILNLIKNSLEAYAKEIIVSIDEYDSTKSFLVIRIQDNGHGIKKEDRQQIFNDKFTTKPKGSGMGLPSCQYILNKHQGRIDFISVPNKTVFSIYLPLKSYKKNENINS